MFNATERVKELWDYFDKMLDERIKKISELSDVPLECFVKINPADFIEKSKYQIINGYEYKNIGKWIAEKKKDDHTFLISPLDAINETAAQVSYKQGTEISRKIRASKCECVPISRELSLDFFIRNHRQTAPLLRETAICFGLAYAGELVAVMVYDKADGAVRGKKKNYELLRLSIAKGTQIHGGASKLQKRCEETLRLLGETEIFSYSNATINSGGVYNQLGFSQKKIARGQPFVIMENNKITRLINLYPESTNEKIARHGWLQTHIGGNKLWVKNINQNDEQ